MPKNIGKQQHDDAGQNATNELGEERVSRREVHEIHIPPPEEDTDRTDDKNGADGMFNLNLPAWTGPQPSESAVHLLTDAIGGSARPVTLVTLGPFTDIALALQADPGIGHKIAMIYAMAGAVRVNGNEPKYSNAEWNVYIDAVAASRVLRSGVPMTFVPLDATGNVPVSEF